MRKIVFATNNKHKLEEIRNISEGNLEILSLADINCYDDIEETAETLEENALIKARHIKNKYGYDCFADDSGLEVEALNGAPGVYSSRYAGDKCDPIDNMKKLITVLQGVENRKAQFRTVIALIIDNTEHLFEGVIKGKIIDEMRGEGGFGYDPIFIPEGSSKTFAELGVEYKNKVSHRAIATNKLMENINS